MKTPSNNINVIMADNERVLSLTGDVDFTLIEENAHLADVIGSTVLLECKKNDTIKVPKGKYNLRILAVLTSDSNE